MIIRSADHCYASPMMKLMPSFASTALISFFAFAKRFIIHPLVVKHLIADINMQAPSRCLVLHDSSRATSPGLRSVIAMSFFQVLSFDASNAKVVFHSLYKSRRPVVRTQFKAPRVILWRVNTRCIDRDCPIRVWSAGTR